MESDRQFSLHVSRALDCLGKSKDMVKYRVETYNEEEQIRNFMFGGHAETIIAGSKGEGLTAVYESDVDIMLVLNDVTCADNIAPFRNINNVIVFEAERRNTPPGYTKLRLNNLGGLNNRHHIQQSLLKDHDEQFYFSSDFYVNSKTQKMNESFRHVFNLYRRGPSCSYDFNCIVPHSQDMALAFRYNCPEIIESFINRPRDHDWPTNDQLTEIFALEGHVVPVGYTGSQTAFVEWRICYTKAERFLMRSLNDTQTKMYILLKMVSVSYISFFCKEITSYLWKNVVLWLAEYNNIETFKEALLVDRVIHALKFLRKCVINNNLPSYMIPERNLFSGKLDLSQRKKLIILLTELIDKGGSLLFGCERLCGTMIVLNKEPALAEQYRCKRDMIEKLYVWHLNILKEKISSGESFVSVMTDEANMNIKRILDDILLPDRRSLERQGHDAWSTTYILWTRQRQWLS